MEDDFVCECCPYFIDGYCHNCTHEDCEKARGARMTKPDKMIELEEKINNAAKECSDRLWNKKWNPRQDMLAAAFIEGVKWLARESMKEQAEDNKPKLSAEDIAELDKKAFIERAMGREDIAKAYEACSYSIRRHSDDSKNTDNNC